jgi:hypothetical protein
MSYYIDKYNNKVDEETGYIVKEYPSVDEYDDESLDISSFGIRSADDIDENCW